MIFARLILALAALAPLSALPAGVLVNEIFYHGPDEGPAGPADDFQWIEIHNASDAPADLGGFRLQGGPIHVFAAGTTIEARGYLVLARDPERFREIHGFEPAGKLEGALGKGGGRIVLEDAAGKAIDEARYKDEPPWPLSPDGHSSSLERICPAASGLLAESWAASPLPADLPRPAGTPGKPNAAFSAVLPPVIASVKAIPEDPAPETTIQVEAAIQVEAEVKERPGLDRVVLHHRTVTAGAEGEEAAIPMERAGPADAKGSVRFRAAIPPQTAGSLVRFRIEAVDASGARRWHPDPNDLRPTHSVWVEEPWEPAKVSRARIVRVGRPRTEEEASERRRPGFLGGLFGGGRGGFGPRRSARVEPPRGTTAFIYRDAEGGRTLLFDHLRITERAGERGFKVHFHRDRTLKGMTVASLVFEGSERFLLAEAMAYDVYRRAGLAAPRTEFLRLWVDGRPRERHLLIEQPNRAFLRRNKVRDDGDLFKILWYERGVIGQHQRRTRPGSGHRELQALLERLGKTSGDEQWEAIRAGFDVDQTAGYFAVNAVLSHWDGFFNNHFVYHDVHGTGKWTIYPWDQDKTWGWHDGIRGGEIFFDMPLTFGMEGDRPPAPPSADGKPRRPLFGGGPFGGGVAWWRPGGWFSRPLLANARFREVFLARVRKVLEEVYSPAAAFPVLEETARLLREDSRLLAGARGEDPRSAEERLEQDVRSLREHLEKRRAFLLAQEEMKGR